MRAEDAFRTDEDVTRFSWIPAQLDLVVKPAVSGMGMGMFAGEPIPEGTCILEYVGPKLTKQEVLDSESVYLFEINSRKTIDGAVDWNRARWINHSCDPNCEPYVNRGRVFIHAIQDIGEGEELTYNYGEWYFEKYLEGKCLCPQCVAERAKKAAKLMARKPAKARSAA
jgi:hypothetical protein